ncbi:7TMR-DISM family protein [Sporocytophaga myxococcoides]|nr:7TM diverse intracellular signaling domain-containing protein [Sporocytophaga myxococcoides]
MATRLISNINAKRVIKFTLNYFNKVSENYYLHKLIMSYESLMKYFKLLSFFLLFSLTGQGFSSSVFILNENTTDTREDSIFTYFKFYKDASNQLFVNQLRQKNFQTYNHYQSSEFDKNSTYWFRIEVSNKSEDQKEWFFEILDPHIQAINVFVIYGNDTTHFSKTGYLDEFSSRISKHKNFIFPIKFYKDDKATILFSIKNNYFTRPDICIRTPQKFLDYALSEYYYLGIFYGILLIMSVYNIFIYFSTRENVYLYYVAYVVCYSLNSFSEDGLGFQYVWPDFPGFNELIQYAPILLITAFVFYSKTFLSLKQYAPKLRKGIDISLIIYCIMFCINNFFLQISWIRYFYLLPFILIFIAAITATRKGNKSAKYFILAFSLFLISFSIFILRINGFVATNIYTVYSLNFGFLLEVVLFSSALGQRLKIEKEEKTRIDKMLIMQLQENEKLKDSINQELELKVRERTEEVNRKNRELAIALSNLEEKSKQIEELNKLLEIDNKALNQNIKDITKARLMLKDVTLEEFQKIYPDEESCFKYLSEIKWTKGYICKKCSNKNSSAGKTPYSKRCTKCGYDESVTTYTIFHNSKLPITQTFYLSYLVLANKNISSHELSEKLKLRQKTCWAFKKKIIDSINSSGTGKLNSKDWGKIFYNSNTAKEQPRPA